MAILPLFAAAAAAAITPVSIPIEATGPLAPLKGTLVRPAGDGPVVILIPGSGPTDRDGNSPLGVRASTYRLLAEGLAQRGIATLRIDKRGMFDSRRAVADGNDVTLPEYATDLRAWIRVVRARTGVSCVWLLGHSEGGLVALLTAQDTADVCGLILVSTAGRKMGVVLREQLRADPANAPMLAQADAAIDALEHGRAVDVSTMHPALAPLFAQPIQKYMRSLMSYDPAAMIAKIRKPLLILQGDRDLQVGVKDAGRLKAANPRALLEILVGANHVLKEVASADVEANLAAYGDPALPLATRAVPAIADFVLNQSRLTQAR